MTNIYTGTNPFPNSTPVAPTSTSAKIDEIRATLMQGAQPVGAAQCYGRDTFEKPEVWKMPDAGAAKANPAIAELDKACEQIQGYKDNPNVTDEFKAKVLDVSKNLNMEPKALISIMAYETGGSFSPSQKNRAGSGATGLIQFMPGTARGLGTTTEELAKMSSTEQLDYVEKYFTPHKGKLNSVADAYMAVLWPAAIGKPMEHVLFDKEENAKRYNQNRGLDLNNDGKITKEEAAHKVRKFAGEI